MPIKLVAPLKKEFTLDKSDEKYGTDGEPSRITIRQATQSQHEKRASVFEEINQVYNQSRESDEMVLRSRWSMEELKRMETFLTLIDCNLVDYSGVPLFKFGTSQKGEPFLDMSTNEFAQAWGELPSDIADEIHSKVWEVNLTWANPMGR